MLRWAADDFDRPWRCRNPADLALLAQLLQRVGQGRHLVVALEPTGTYGDALRQALEQAGLAVHRVSPKAAADYAETFDGVPSQHDGKDAAVVAELAAQGRCWPWPLVVPNEVEGELAYQVEWLDGQRRQTQLWYGRLEALLSRHWPEATALLPLTSGVLRRCLARYGGPRGLAEDPEAAERLYRWGKGLLGRDKAEALVASAGRRPACRWAAGTRSACAAMPRRCKTACTSSGRRGGGCGSWRRRSRSSQAMGAVVGPVDGLRAVGGAGQPPGLSLRSRPTARRWD